MKDIVLNIIKDELPFSTWILAGAGIQAVATLLLPKYVAVLPALLLISSRVVLYYLTTAGLRDNQRTKDTHYGIRVARVPRSPLKPLNIGAANGGAISQPTSPLTAPPPQSYQQQHYQQQQQHLGLPSPGRRDGGLGLGSGGSSGGGMPKEEQVVLFIIGARSTSVAGRRAPDFKKLSNALARITAEAEQGRQRYGFLGRSAPLISTELGQGNALITLTYWRGVDGLMAFARESAAHRESWAWFADGISTPSSSSSGGGSGAEEKGQSMGDSINEKNATSSSTGYSDGGRLKDIGIMHELYFCPESMASKYYLNFKPFGFGQTKFLVEDEHTGETKLEGPTMVEKRVRWPPVIRTKSENYITKTKA